MLYLGGGKGPIIGTRGIKFEFEAGSALQGEGSTSSEISGGAELASSNEEAVAVTN